MRNLFLSLMVLTALVSCGKDNKVGSVNGSASSAIVLDDSVARQLGSYIDASDSYFGNTAYNQSMTWKQAIITYSYAKYIYASTSAASAAQSCETKTGWFGIKYYVCSSSSSGSNLTYTGTNINSVDLETKRAQLRGFINSSTAGGGVVASGTAFLVRTTTGIIYTIDMRFPIQANPVSVQQANGQITYFVGLAATVPN